VKSKLPSFFLALPAFSFGLSSNVVFHFYYL